MSLTDARSPYRGLMPYQEEDAAFFFGRTTDIGLVIANLLASRLTLLYGASGVGKSSVLNAGVVPQLRKLAASNGVELGKPEIAVIVFRNWADSPARSLALAVRQACADAAAGPLDLARDGGLLAALREGSAQVGGDVLVILDQFEEHFLYAAQPDDSESFDEALVAALNDRGLRANFLISVREDGIARLDQYKGRIPKLFDNYLRVQRLDAAAAREAIEKPVERYNALCRVGQPPITLGDGLVDAVLSDVQTGRVTIGDDAVGAIAATTGSDMRFETPFLQLVMTQLWKTEIDQGSTELRRNTFVDALGGARSIVQSHVRDALRSLTPDENRLALAAFRFLITPSRTKIALKAADLAAMADLPPQPLADLLEKLTGSGYRILKPVAPPPDRAGAVSYEIWHDVLAEAILDWRAAQLRIADLQAARERSQAELQAAHQRAEEKERVARRSRGITVIVSVCLALSILALVFAWRQRGIAQEQALLAQRRKLVGSASSVLATDPELGVLLAAHVLRETLNARFVNPGSNVAAEAADALAHAIAASRVRQTFITGLNASPARIGVAAAGAALVVVGEDNRVVRLDLGGAARRDLVTPASKVVDMALAPDGARVALALEDKTLQIVDASKGTVETSTRLSDKPVAIAWSQDGGKLVSATEDGRVTLWDAAAGISKKSDLASNPDGYPLFVALDVSPDGQKIAAAGSDRIVRVWSLSRSIPEGPQLICGHTDEVKAVRFAPDSRRLVTGSMDNTALLWTVDETKVGQTCTSTPLRRFVGHVNTVFDVRFSQDGRTLATASADTTIKLWEVETGRTLLTLLGHRDPVEGIAFLDKDRVASVSWDGTARVWDVTGPADVFMADDAPPGGNRVVTLNQDGRGTLYDRQTGNVDGQAFFPGATQVALDVAGNRVAHADYWSSVVEYWAILNQPGAEFSRLLVSLSFFNNRVTALAVSPDGHRLASGTRDGRVQLWDETGRQLAKVDHDYTIELLGFSPDGKLLFSGDASGEGRLSEMAGNRVIPLQGHTRTISAAVWSGDHRWLLTTSQDRTARLWSLPDGDSRKTMKHSGMVMGASFSADSRRLLTVGDNIARRFDVASGDKIEPELVGHEAWITAGRYSPDGTRIATVSWDRTARLWDASTGQALARYTHDGQLHDVIFSPDGTALITVSEAGQVRYIPIDHQALLRLADERATRRLTALECQVYLDLQTCPGR